MTWRAVDVEAARWSILLIFALAINCALTGSIWFGDHFVGFSLPAGYYGFRKFEANGKLYECLGVRAARRIFRHSPAVRFSGRRESLPGLESDRRLAETHHMLSPIVVVLVAAVELTIGQPRLAVGLLIFGIVLQLCPVVLQRYNRNRLLKLMQRSDRNDANVT